MQSVFNVSGIHFHPLLNSPVFLNPIGECNHYEPLAFQSTNLACLLSDFIGTEDALVMNSFDEAADLLLSCLVYGREVVAWAGPNEPYAFFSQLCSRLLAGGAKKVTKSMIADPEHLAVEPDDKTFISLRRQVQTASEQYYLTVSDQALWQSGTETITVEWVEQPSLVDLSSFGHPKRSWIQSHVDKDTDLILFPGGGLIGGPSLGFIAGGKTLISRLKGMRIFTQAVADPLNVGRFKQLLQKYMDGEALPNVPVLCMMAAKAEDIQARAIRLADVLEQSLENYFTFEVRAAKTWLADGDCSHVFPTYQVVMRPLQGEPKAICERLLQNRPSIITGVTGDGNLAVDLRTLPEQSDEVFTAALITALQEFEKPAEVQYIDLIPQIVWTVDKHGALVYMSKPCADFFNLETGDFTLGQDMADVLPHEITESLLEKKDMVMDSGVQERLDVKITAATDGFIWLDVIVSPMTNEDGSINQVMFVASDITARKTAEEELKYLGIHDMLTGLYNRNYFEEEMKRLSSIRHFPISIVICDIDGLKFINDTLGHEFGDRMLKTTASILKKTFRTSDVVARIGGDEFAIILPQTDTKTAQNIMERAEHAITEFNQSKKDIPLNLSFGLANGTDADLDMMDLFKKADDAMYKNKLAKRPQQKKQIVDALLELMSEKSFLKEGQVGRLQQMTGLLGKYVGLSDGEISQILLLCQIYNIGRISLDDSTLLKTGKLSPQEWEAVRRYPEVGYRITSSLPELDSVADCILQHRERWDGDGYPQGLKGEDIHLYSRILAVVDAYHAMVSPRPYREPMRHEDALKELKKNRGTQFDPRITDIFLSIMEQKVVSSPEQR